MSLRKRDTGNRSSSDYSEEEPLPELEYDNDVAIARRLIEYEINYAYDFSSWDGSIDLTVRKAFIDELSYQAINAREVAKRAVMVWLMCDDISKAAIFVCCRSGNKFSKIQAKGRIAGANYLHRFFVDSNSPSDLTLGRFLVIFGPMFAAQVQNYHKENCGHAAYSDNQFQRNYLDFLDRQLYWWTVYNPDAAVTQEVVNKTARIMCLQRASICLPTSDAALEFRVKNSVVKSMSEGKFRGIWGCDPPLFEVHRPNFNWQDIVTDVTSTSAAMVKAIKRRKKQDHKPKIEDL